MTGRLPVVDVVEDDDVGAAGADTSDAPETKPAAARVHTERSTTRITGGNKFEPNPTGSNGATAVGGQRHSGAESICSALGKIVKGLKKALTHD